MFTFLCIFVAEVLSTKGRGSKKGKKKKRSKAVHRDLTLCQAQQNMFGGYYKVRHISINSWRLF